jgi:hypothetical protein
MITIVRRLFPTVTPDEIHMHYPYNSRYTKKEDVPLKEYMKRFATESKGGANNEEHITYNGRRYCVRSDVQNERYITSQNQKVYLSTIQGKYKYCK